MGCFSDFEEDELFLSMDVDAVINQTVLNIFSKIKELSKKRNFQRVLIESVRELRVNINTMIKVFSTAYSY